MMKTVLRALFSRRKFTVLAVATALTLGTASAALAGSGVGGVFNLGVTNTVNAITKLTGSVAGSSLQIVNNSTNAAATALNLQVATGKPPLKVNSTTKVANLNADQLDELSANQISRGTTNGGDTFTLVTGTSLETNPQLLHNTDITAPQAGALLISWSSYKRCSGPDIAEVKLFLDGVGDNSFFVVPSCETNGQFGTESFQKLVKVNGGLHNIQIRARDFTGAPNNLELDDSRLDVVFIPFDANGGTVFGASSSLEAASSGEASSKASPGR